MTRPPPSVCVQASLVSWENAPDVCGNEFEGRLVVEHTLARARQEVPGRHFLVAPDLPANRDLVAVAERHGVTLLLGSVDDVVSRFCGLPADVDRVLRVAGMHPFFSGLQARDALARLASGDVDVVEAPEDLDVQLTTQALSVEALRRSRRDTDDADPRLLRDPVRFLEATGARRVRLEACDAYHQASDRARQRHLAQHIYQDDILPTGATPASPLTSQILAHYQLALDAALGRALAIADRPLAAPRPWRVLDVGGGFGFRPWLAERLGAIDYTLVDLDAGKLAEAARRDPGCRTLQADGRELPLDDGSYDIVLAFEILEHVTAPERLLQELLRVTGGGGLAAVSTPQNRSGLIPLNPHHLMEFTLEGFRRLCASTTATVSYLTFQSGAIHRPGLHPGNNMMAFFSHQRPPSEAP